MEHLAQVYPNHNNAIGLHSLRSGGASSAADNGVSDRLIAKHGRWSSNSYRDCYIKDNKMKLATYRTQCLGTLALLDSPRKPNLQICCFLLCCLFVCLYEDVKRSVVSDVLR